MAGSQARDCPLHQRARAARSTFIEIWLPARTRVRGRTVVTLGDRRAASLNCRMPKPTYKIRPLALRAATLLLALAATASAQDRSRSRVRAVILQRDAVFDSAE